MLHSVVVSLVRQSPMIFTSSSRYMDLAVDSFPILEYVPSWFPGAGFKRLAADLANLTEDVRTRPFIWLQKQLVRVLPVLMLAVR